MKPDETSFFQIWHFLVMLIHLTRLMKKSRQFTWCDSKGWRVPGRHVGRDSIMSYQSRQLDQRDWCLSHDSLFGVTQFPKYPTPSLSLSSSSLSFFLRSPPRGGSIGDSYFSPQIIPHGALNRFHELVFQSCWVCTSSSPSHFLVFWNYRLNELMW
jgi:hypothetical protein